MCLLIWLLTIVRSMEPFLLWFNVFKRSFDENGILKLFTLGVKATYVLIG